MAPELGGSQISQLLESVPGIASVLRSPVADALVNMIRAGAGLEKFDLRDAEELVQYSVRRGLLSAHEGERLMAQVSAAEPKKRSSAKARGGGRSRAGVGRKRPKTAKRPRPQARKKRAPQKRATKKKVKAGKRAKKR